jgi:NitT/TauT family transport system permease protein
MKTILRYFVSGFLLILFWQVLSLMISSMILPPPLTAFKTFLAAIAELWFWKHFAVSALRVTAAMALAFLVGFPMGILLGYHRRVDAICSPFVFLTYPIPKIVLLPVFLVVFGLGDFARIFMIALIIGFQIVVAVRDAVLGLDRKYVDSLRSLGGEGAQIFRHVVVPAALPHGFTALRIGTGTGIAVLFFVESFATSRGLGYHIMDSWGRFAYDQMFVGIIGMSLLGVMLYEFFNSLERLLCAWQYLSATSRN